MKRILLLVLPLIVMSTPMSARGDTQPAPAQTAQTASADVASDAGTQVAIDLTYDPAKVAITKLIAPAQVAVDVIIKPMDVALMIVKPVKLALQIMKPRTKVALTKIHRLASAESFDIICEI